MLYLFDEFVEALALALVEEEGVLQRAGVTTDEAVHAAKAARVADVVGDEPGLTAAVGVGGAHGVGSAGGVSRALSCWWGWAVCSRARMRVRPWARSRR